MPETFPQPFVAAAPVRGRRAHSLRRAPWRLVAVLSVLALVLAACGSDSASALTVGSKTVDESTVKDELTAITKNKVLKAQAVKNGKLDPAAAATWLTFVRFKKVPEPLVILAAGLAGLILARAT